MKGFLLGTVAVLALAAPASAADLYTKAPPPPIAATIGAGSMSALTVAGVQATSAGTL